MCGSHEIKKHGIQVFVFRSSSQPFPELLVRPPPPKASETLGLCVHLWHKEAGYCRDPLSPVYNKKKRCVRAHAQKKNFRILLTCAGCVVCVHAGGRNRYHNTNAMPLPTPGIQARVAGMRTTRGAGRGGGAHERLESGSRRCSEGGVQEECVRTRPDPKG